jgi:transcriptional regulator with XRE-family HTH domain
MESTVFYEKLKHLSMVSGKSFNQIEKELHYPRNALNNYKRLSVPSATRLLELSEYFKVDPGYLLGKQVVKRKLIENTFRTLNNEQKKEMYFLLREWVKSQIK